MQNFDCCRCANSAAGPVRGFVPNISPTILFKPLTATLFADLATFAVTAFFIPSNIAIVLPYIYYL